jgi:hypothetical protein
MAFDERTADRVRAILSGRPDVVEKKMMGGLCFMVKGGMCCSVSGRGGSWSALILKSNSTCFGNRTCGRWRWVDGR